jgi:DNA-binding MarR family transcriptional regulator
MRPGGDGGTLAYDEAVPRRITSPNLVFRTFVVDQLVGGLLGEAIAPSGLGPGEFGVLSAMRVVQPVMPSELAAELGMPPTTLSAHIRRFDERGWIERTANPRDGRSYLLSVSAPGVEALEAAYGGLRRTIEELEAALDRPAEDVGEALAALERALRRVADERRSEARLVRTRTN